MNARHLDPAVEVPDDDRVEQSLEVDPEDDSLYADDVEEVPTTSMVEADPGDVLDQSLEVDLDDGEDEII
ncbi:hypothetical protein [Brevibacterium sp.]|uniref:hypothetical protein n=1 Tax=Brevibacterium sp. TaxID=1701 RepID=UPI0028119C34|nr:hypothetical protein [Brevibacterium sp.]